MKRLLFVVAALVLLVGADSVPVRSITNGDFEGGIAGWSSYADIANSMAGWRTGGSGIIIANLQNLLSSPGYLWQTETGVDPGETWRIDGWIQINSGTFNFGWFQSLSPYNPGPNNITSVGGGWQSVSVTQSFTSTTENGYRDVEMVIYGAGAGANLDDISTTLTTNVDDWCFY